MHPQSVCECLNAGSDQHKLMPVGEPANRHRECVPVESGGKTAPRTRNREVPLVRGQVERYDIDVWFTSMVFPPGHRLRVSIASALFPKYDRNLNTGGNNERDTTFVVAHQRVLHDAAHPSHVMLPVVPR